MRWLVALLAACGGGGPTCKDVSTEALVIGYCEQDAWSAELRGCVAKAKTPGEASVCFPVKPMPALELAPSQATLDAIGKNPKGLTAVAFLDREGAPELARYLDKLPLHVERYDRFKDYQVAAQYKVVRDGLVLVRGERREIVELADRPKERVYFDANVLNRIEKLKRDPRHAYLLTGHGEITDPEAKPAARPRATTSLMRALTELALSPAPLALTGDVPADASVVLWLGPQTALSPAQEQALIAYLLRGGALLVALDPDFPVGLGALGPVLAVRFDPGHLTDDKAFLPIYKDKRDHRVLGVKPPDPHARSSGALPLIDSGTLSHAEGATVVVTIESMASSFIDKNDNFEHDDDEPRQKYPVAIATVGAAFRSQVYADADLFADVKTSVAGRVYVTFPFAQSLPDAIQWLLGDDAIAKAPEAAAPSKPQLDAIAAAQAARDHDDQVRRAVENALRKR